jgi:5'-nucleotidase
LLDAGDALLNDHHPATTTRGQTSIEAMNRLGYDAMALGLLDLSLLTLEDLRARIAEAQFSVLSANAFLTNTEELIAAPYAIVKVAGRSIGILGITEPGATPQVVVGDPVKAVERWLPVVQREADVVVLLSHAGIEIDKRLAGEIKGIDVVISGRQQPLDKPMVVPETGTLVLHAESPRPGNAGQVIGVAHVTFDALGRLLKHDWTRHVLSADVYASDPETEQWALELASAPM